MSRIGKKPIAVPGGVTVELAAGSAKVKGSKGELSFSVPSPISVALEDNVVLVTRSGNNRDARACHGMVRAILANMVHGVVTGYEKRLHVYGTGYSCNVKAGRLHLNCGFMGRGDKNTPQFDMEIPKGIDVEIEVAAARGDSDPAKMIIRGCDKQAVGQFAAVIRRIRPPEPYKGKGIRYHDEVVRRKAGKALASGG